MQYTAVNVAVLSHHRRLIGILALVLALAGVIAYAAHSQDQLLADCLPATPLMPLVSLDVNSSAPVVFEFTAGSSDPFLSNAPDRAPPLGRLNHLI